MRDELPLAGAGPMGHKHLLCDLWLDDTARLQEVGSWPQVLLGVADRIQARVIGQQFHQFKPCGVTGFLLLSESHISVHTWPEERLAAIDIFTCGELDPGLVMAWLRDQLNPTDERVTLHTRGRPLRTGAKAT